MNDLHDLSQMDLNLLVAFATLAQEQSVTRAAGKLGLTQSAMSHSLRRLRVALDDPLMIRAGQGMVLTPRAQALVVPLRSALADIQRALARTEHFAPADVRCTIRMSSIDLFDALVLPALLTRLRSEAPGVDLVLAPRGRLRDREIEAGDLDLAVRTRLDRGDWMDEPLASGLVQRVILRDGFSCFLRRGHPSLRSGRLIMREFVAAPHLMISPTGSGPGVTDQALAAIGERRRIALRLPEFSAALPIIASNDMILTAPTSLRLLLPRYPGVICCPSPLELPGHRVVLVWHGRFTQDPLHRWFRELLSEGAAAMADAIDGASGLGL